MPDGDNILITAAWADMRGRVAAGLSVRAEDYLGDPGFPSHNHDRVLDLVYGEFAVREQAGGRPEVDEYAARFRHLADRIRRQFGLHSAISYASDGGTLAAVAGTAVHPADATDAPASSTEGLPTTVGKYRVVSRLGSGGQATVYRGVHPTLEQDVVIKVGHHRLAADTFSGDRLAAEARMLVGLSHPNPTGWSTNSRRPRPGTRGRRSSTRRPDRPGSAGGRAPN